MVFYDSDIHSDIQSPTGKHLIDIKYLHTATTGFCGSNIS